MDVCILLNSSSGFFLNVGKPNKWKILNNKIAWLSLNFILKRSWVALYSVVCEWVCEASVSLDQISTFFNMYRHTSPLLTLYHLIPISTNLYWPSTSQFRHILTQCHQAPLIIHHLVRHSSANWIISLFTTHLMSHAQNTWSSFQFFLFLKMKTSQQHLAHFCFLLGVQFSLQTLGLSSH